MRKSHEDAHAHFKGFRLGAEVLVLTLTPPKIGRRVERTNIGVEWKREKCGCVGGGQFARRTGLPAMHTHSAIP